MKRIIPLYIIREMLPPFFISLFIFTFISLMASILELTELVVIRGVKPLTIINLLGLSLPFFLSLTLPISTLLAVLLTFLRLSGDNEITVLKSAGVGLYKILPPVILFGLWGYMVTSYLSLELVPTTRYSFRNGLLEMAKARADLAIKEQVFNSSFEEMLIFVNRIPIDSDMMEGIFIQDRRDAELQSTIVASRGRVATDPDQRVLIFQLFDGLIDRVNPEDKISDTVSFRRYELKLHLKGEGAGGLVKRNQAEMSMEELWQTAETLRQKGASDYPQYLLEAHQRLSLPLSCLVFAIIAVPLGVQFRGRGRNWGISAALVIMLAYHVMLLAVRSMGESAQDPPTWGIWAPNFVIGGIGLYLLHRANKDAPIGIGHFFSGLNRILTRWNRTGK